MTNLNQKLRDKIIDSVIEKGTTIPARKEALKKKTSLRVREIDMSRVPKEFAAATKNLPPEWFPLAASAQFSPKVCPDSYIELTDSEMRSQWKAVVSYEPFRHPMSARFIRPDEKTRKPIKQDDGSYEDQPDDENSWEFLLGDLLDEAKQIRDDEAEARKSLRQFLYSVRTYKQVLEKMPELERHLPDYTKPMPLTVPVAPILKQLGKLGFDQAEKA